jgi:hypothetical protein
MKAAAIARRVDRRTAVAFAAAAATLPLLVLDPLYAALAAGLVLIVLIGLNWGTVLRIRLLRRDISAKRTAAERVRPLDDADPRLRRIFEALNGGFPQSAMREVRAVARNTRIPIGDRYAVLQAVAAWQTEHEKTRRSEPERSAFDVVFIVGGEPGGAAASAAQIAVCRDLGLSVGVLHHPVYRAHPNPPLPRRIQALVDGGSVRRIGLDDEVECALAVVRSPLALMHPLERRPRIAAGRTAVVADRTPFKRYGEAGPRDQVWSVEAVARHVKDWLGEHTWYAGGPLVQAVLREHHAEAFADLDLAAEPWGEVVEVDQWRLDGRRVPDGSVRIGRAAADHGLKWPEEREVLLECYPDREPFEIHVLGGAEAPARLLGGLPENWTVHMPAPDVLGTREFLAAIDVMVCFTEADAMGACDRAPLEAMAAGVPVIMDRRFAPAFGPAAVYCEPGEVAAVAERLAGDAAAYAGQQAVAWAHLADRFSAKALMDRLPLAAAAGVPSGERRQAIVIEFQP